MDLLNGGTQLLIAETYRMSVPRVGQICRQTVWKIGSRCLTPEELKLYWPRRVTVRALRQDGYRSWWLALLDQLIVHLRKTGNEQRLAA